MQMQWNILQPNTQLVETIRDHLDCHPILAKILANRGLSSTALVDAFMSPDMADLPSPMLLPDMDKAVVRLCAALQRGEKLLVIGDYDADGVTAAAVLVDFLQSAGADVKFHLPHRIEEGYGFSPTQVMQIALPQKIDVIITVDCGSSSHEAVDAAKRFGIDVIVTDHHTPGSELPDAVAVVNPKREGHPQALVDLAGVGVAFYLAIALRMALRDQGWWDNRPEPNLKSLCDLVAIGTVADIVPLTGVNRILTRAGLQQICTFSRPGIQALISASGIRSHGITADDIAFRLAPRINAAGRMAHAQLAYDLLRASDATAAKGLAETLNALNSRRQLTENKIYQKAVQRIDHQPGLVRKKSILLVDPQWHSGVLGIVAAKLAARYARPVVLLSAQEGVAKGSGRSIPQVDLYAALDHCRDLLDKFGGHRMAGGLTVQIDKISLLRKRFEEAVGHALSFGEISPELTIDSEIGFDEIDGRLLDELERLEPYGEKNPAPVFLARNVRVTSAYTVGRQHRCMIMCQDSCPGSAFRAIHFNAKTNRPGITFFDQLAFRLQWNRYKGTQEIQLVVEAY